ncbi:MAG: ATPase, T2SS/T4P/T4SS family [Pseudomonadota bacterium]
MAFRVKKRLGQILLEAGKTTEEELQKALAEQAKTGEKLGKVILRIGLLKEQELIRTLSEQLKVPIIDLNSCIVEEELLNQIGADMARNYQILPIAQNRNVLTLAMVDPLDIAAIDEVIHKTQREVDLVICSELEMKYALDRYFGTTSLVEDTLKTISDEDFSFEEEGADLEKLRGAAEGAAVIKLVNNLLTQAILDAASDIHVEPAEKNVRVRMRIDGILHELPPIPQKMKLSIISRIKIMSEMDIAKMRAPQDGRFEVVMEGRDVSVRVSSFPTYYGENIVMRLLDKTASLYRMDRLGLDEVDVGRMEAIIKKPYGFILSTGPTGSGKTTTLYAVLNIINSAEKNIITLEDPIEYTIDMVRQAQINPKAGLTFESGLRSILRQDPDMIMVGEIRDKSTADIAIHSALTGHIVFSTLHTNDAPSAITRLVDMGVEPFLVASSITGVLGQRLMRLICDKCRTSYTASSSLLQQLGLPETEKVTLYKGEGCMQCRYTGYKGRTGVFELLTVNEEIRDLTLAKASSESIGKAAQRNGMQTMRKHALKKVLQGLTTIEEAAGVIQTD